MVWLREWLGIDINLCNQLSFFSNLWCCIAGRGCGCLICKSVGKGKVVRKQSANLYSFENHVRENNRCGRGIAKQLISEI